MKQTQPIETGIAVVDLDRMLDFYQTVLGCTEARRADIPPELSSQLTLATNGYVCVWLRTPGGEIIKLMSPPQPPQLTPPDRGEAVQISESSLADRILRTLSIGIRGGL